MEIASGKKFRRQRAGTDAKMDGMGPVLLGGMWNAWSAALGREPRTELDEFFAVTVFVKEEYARRIPGLVRVHEQLCTQVRKTLEEKNRPMSLHISQ